MSRDTSCDCWYSDRSMRISPSLPNSACASAVQTEVFPTPVEPVSSRAATGRASSRKPAPPRRTARQMAFTAASCPMTVRQSSCSSWSSRCAVSPSAAAEKPSNRLATRATSCAVMSFPPSRCTAAQVSSSKSIALSGRCRSGLMRTEILTAACRASG